MGTAGSIKNAQQLIGDETFLVISGDALTDIDLAKVIEFHRERQATVTIALKRVTDPLEFGVVVTDEDGRIDRFLEKPSWGQVFSDTINTGIYVLEPEIFNHIPAEGSFDFSSELFPLLMEKGFPLFGCVVDGYWCDVGSLETYVEVHRDILDGKVNTYVPGVKAKNRVWVDEGAKIDPSAVIGDKVVIGPNVTLREGAHVGDYVVLGDNCVIGKNARVNHSILWNDTFAGKHSSVEGAVLCRRVDVRANAAIAPGAVIGDESMIGHGARVGADVQIYPYKRVEPAAVVNTSIIWESTGTRSLFGEHGIAGLVGVDMTPELALKAAQAHGSMLPKGSHLVVSRDGSHGARMVKRAMVAGLNSAGCNVRDLRVASPALNRYTTRDTRCVGGIHVCQSPSDPQSLELHFFDKTGLDLAPWAEKKLERLYFRGEFRRAFLDEVGQISYPPRALEYYAAGLTIAVERRLGSQQRRVKVVADLSGGAAAVVLPQVAASWEMDVAILNGIMGAESAAPSGQKDVTSAAELARAVEIFDADMGVRIDPLAERIEFLGPDGTFVDGEAALLTAIELWCRTDATGLPIAVPITATSAVEVVASRTGHEVVRPGRTRRSMAAFTLDSRVGFAGNTFGGFMFADFLAAYDAVVSMGMLASMLGQTGETLGELIAGLPASYRVVEDIFCPTHRKGAVMRAVTEATAGKKTDLTEGIKVFDDDDWVLVLPHASEAFVQLFAEGADSQATQRLVATWRERISSAIGEE